MLMATAAAAAAALHGSDAPHVKMTLPPQTLTRTQPLGRRRRLTLIQIGKIQEQANPGQPSFEVYVLTFYLDSVGKCNKFT